MTIEEVTVSPASARQGSKRKGNSGPLKINVRKSCEITVRCSGGIAIHPPQVQLSHAKASAGLRIVNEEFRNRRYEVEVEGRSAQEYRLVFSDPGTMVKSIENGLLEKREGETITVKTQIPAGSEYQHLVVALVT